MTLDESINTKHNFANQWNVNDLHILCVNFYFPRYGVSSWGIKSENLFLLPDSKVHLTKPNLGDSSTILP